MDESMKTSLRNIMLEKLKMHSSITDAELMNILAKDGIQITESKFNKVLLDLEIFGLIRVGWISKDKRRIELVKE